jgi:hypothetical protein
MNENFTAQSAAPQPPPAPAAAAPPPVVMHTVVVDRKSPGLAGFLSMFPGLGHLYLGLYPRAFAVGGAFALGIMLTSHGRAGEFFGPLIAFVWFFGINDAVRQAKAINRGQVAESGFAPEQQIRKAAEGTGALTWGVILVGVGGLWLADRYVDLDAFWEVVGSWGAPAAFILLGLVLIVSHVRSARRRNEAGHGMPPRSS